MPDQHRPAVLFDLFGVIARVQSAAGKDQLAATAGLTGADGPRFWAAYWARRPRYDRGDVTGSGYWQEVAATLGTRFDQTRIDQLVEADLDSWSAVDDAMVALVEQLAAAGQRIALLSNIPPELADYCERRYRWLGHFEVCAFSCRIGHIKPQPEAYHWCCRALDLDPQRILFIDDHPENLRAAQAVGLRGHLFTDLAQARKAIDEHGPAQFVGQP